MSIYLEIPKFNGGLTLKVEVLSCQFGVGRAITTAVGQSRNRDATTPSITEISVTRDYDKYSPLFYQEAVAGRGHPMIIYFVDPKAKRTYLTITLEDAMISSYQLGRGSKQVESLTINFTKITYKYDPGIPQPTHEQVGYDLVTAKPI